ncbi:MAG: class I SAM-dependent methyltransferase [Sandaracinaceae bacterium]
MTSPTQDEKIGPTAHYTAYVWHRLGMPHAELFRTSLGRAAYYGFRLAGEGLLELHPSIPSMRQYLETRHRTIERAVIDEAPDLVVEIGAGLSRRGVTFAERGVRYLEVDLPHMVRAKRHLLETRAPSALRARIAPHLSFWSADVLTDDFATRLAERIADAARPVVVMEGVLGYFAMAHRRRAVSAIARALAGRGALITELRARGETASVAGVVRFARLGTNVLTRGRGSRDDFATLADAETFLRDAGFRSARALDPIAAGGWARRLPARVFRADGNA